MSSYFVITSFPFSVYPSATFVPASTITPVFPSGCIMFSFAYISNSAVSIGCTSYLNIFFPFSSVSTPTSTSPVFSISNCPTFAKLLTVAVCIPSLSSTTIFTSPFGVFVFSISFGSS